MKRPSKRHHLTLLLLGAAALFLMGGCGRSRDPSALVVGMELSYPPFEMTNEQNEPTGVSVDLARALAKEMGKELRIENIPFSGLIPALKTGKIDLIISSMTRTEERSRSIAFSDPYLTTGLCVLLAQRSGAASIEQLDRPGSRIAVKQGTTGHLFARDYIKQAQLLLFEKEAAAILEVAQGKADAFLYDQMSVYMNWKKHPESTRPLLDPFQKESWAIGIQHGNTKLKAQVNAFLAKFKNDGGFDLLGDKYLSEQKQAFEERGIPFIF